MSNLIPCPSCSGKIDKSAMACPHCGKKLRMGLFAKIMIGLLIFLIILLILLVITLFDAYSPSLIEKSQKENQPLTDVKGPPADPIFLPIDSYRVKLKDGNIYLKTTIQLMLSEQKVAVFLEKNKVAVKDRVTSILKTTSIRDVEKSDTRQLLRQKIIEGIKSILPVDPEWSDSNTIRKVLFEEFQLE